ncbi:esterase-like activity of phytase family protein [bacterium]|nr:esterase-like activity of phytase family protein [bacterium]
MLRRSLGKLTLLLVLAGFSGSAGPLPPRGLLQDLAFHGPGALFGGFSALHMASDASGFLAVSDHGAFVTGRFDRDAAGRITAIHTGAMTRLLGPDGQPLADGMTDSEGLAVAADGSLYVSFEGPARVQRYAGLGKPATFLPVPPAFAAMPKNRALEALALAPDGTLYTIPEISAAPGRPFPVYRFRKGGWDQPFVLPRRGAFLVSDATFGPDGRLYVLEREFRGLGGFATRIRRFDLAETGLTRESTVLQTEPGTHDNLEGLVVWRGPDGLVATMISDDNYLPLFRSQIVEYRLPD